MFEKVILVMGLFAFAKQAPKLISDVLGIDSGNMKLGIGGKLAAGGALGAAAFLGAGAKTGIQNLTHGIANAGNRWKSVGDAKGLKKATAIASALGASTLGLAGSVLAGTASGAARSIPDGLKAKNVSETSKALNSAAEKAIDARGKRESYKANNGGNIGAFAAHITDAAKGVGTWMGISASLKDLQEVQAKANEVKNARKAIDDKLGALLNKYKDSMTTAGNKVKAEIDMDGYKETFAEFDNYGTLLNELEVMKSTGKMSDGRVATSEMITAMSQAEFNLKEQMKKEILEGYDLRSKTKDENGNKLGPTHRFTDTEFNEWYDGELQSLVTDYRTKALKNAKIISDNADKTIGSVKSALENYTKQAIENQNQSIYNFISSNNVTELFEESKNAINSATSSIDKKVSAKYQEAAKKDGK